ncbi:hypothetical protein [Streptomyces sp. Ac-502]|uniref:hypothetical protein n=1 Tax=Streptomyces sp. Ac-502 TaxID=3342801 RepID=UPI0038626559
MPRNVRNEITGDAEIHGTAYQAGHVNTFTDGSTDNLHTGTGDTRVNTTTGTTYTASNVQDDGTDGVHITGGSHGITFNA